MIPKGLNSLNSPPYPRPQFILFWHRQIKGQGPGLVNVLWAERKTTFFFKYVMPRTHATVNSPLASSNTNVMCPCDPPLSYYHSSSPVAL